MSVALDSVLVFGGIMVGEAVVKPLAIALFDRVVLPNLGAVFANHLNPNAAKWLQTLDREQMIEAIATAIGAETKGFRYRPGWIQDLAIRRIEELYRLSKNAEKENGTEFHSAGSSPAVENMSKIVDSIIEEGLGEDGWTDVAAERAEHRGSGRIQEEPALDD